MQRRIVMMCRNCLRNGSLERRRQEELSGGQAFEAEKKKCGQLARCPHGSRWHITRTILRRPCCIILREGPASRGLCSLKPVNGEVIRPLLCLERKEIDEYIKECGIPGILDSTNLEDEYTRNRIRRHILPMMEQEINAKAV